MVYLLNPRWLVEAKRCSNDSRKMNDCIDIAEDSPLNRWVEDIPLHKFIACPIRQVHQRFGTSSFQVVENADL
jgi:hypothetical protein